MQRKSNRKVITDEVGRFSHERSSKSALWEISCGSGLQTAISFTQIAVRRPLPQENTKSRYPMSSTKDHKVTMPNVSHKRPQSHDTQCLWERSPDRDFCNGPSRKSAQDESLGRCCWSRFETAPAAERAARCWDGCRDGLCVGSFTDYCRIKANMRIAPTCT